MPTSSQQEAITALRGVEAGRVLAWLEVIRSLKPGAQHSNAHRRLSQQQLDALVHIQDLPDDHILAYLQSAGQSVHIGSARTIPDRDQSGAGFASVPQQSLGRTLYRSAAGSLLMPSTPNRRTSHNTTKTPSTRETSFFGHSQETSLEERSSASSVSNAQPHNHWCIVCKDHEYATCDGWKRHMKEHETCYPCLLCGPASILGKDRKFSRKGNLVDHLKERHNTSENGSALAEQWKRTESKKAYACGFCVKSFVTLLEQMNHIDNQHFKYHQDMTDWNQNYVILSLLSQPEIKEAWRKELAPKGLSNLDCSWQPSVIADLQVLLEMRQDSPEALAREALTLLGHNESRGDEDELMASPDATVNDMYSDQSWLTVRPEVDATSLGADIDSLSHTFDRTTPQPTFQGMGNGYGVQPLHFNSFSSQFSNTFLESQPYQPQMLGPHQSTRSFQPSSFPANMNNTMPTPSSPPMSGSSTYPPNTNLQTPDALPPNNFLGIGDWQDADFSNAPTAASASEFSDRHDYQADIPQAPDAASFPITHNEFEQPYNPHANAPNSWRRLSLSTQVGNTSPTASQDGDTDFIRIRQGMCNTWLRSRHAGKASRRE